MSNRDHDSDELPEASSPDEFGLLPPTGEISQPEEPEVKDHAPELAPKPTSLSEHVPKHMVWRGFEETQPDEVDNDPDISFVDKEPLPSDDMDMTPMVDVVFLLLIFFMVTASFILQQSIETAAAQTEDPSTNVREEIEPEDDYVEVIIDQNNTYIVTVRDQAEIECTSDTEMRARVRNAKSDYGAKRLIIKAHVDATHRKVVAVWDAGLAIGLERIEIRVTENDF